MHNGGTAPANFGQVQFTCVYLGDLSACDGFSIVGRSEETPCVGDSGDGLGKTSGLAEVGSSSNGYYNEFSVTNDDGA